MLALVASCDGRFGDRDGDPSPPPLQDEADATPPEWELDTKSPALPAPSAPVTPDYGPTVVADPPPPPITGGTLLITRDGKTIVAADPDRDRIWLIDRDAAKLRTEIALRPGDEPGRVAEDDSGRLYVALRRGGAVVTIDAASGVLTARRGVCAAPRGIAYDKSSDSLLVACAGGELVRLPNAPFSEPRTVRVDSDLRDVVATTDGTYVSRFRSSQLLKIDDEGKILKRIVPSNLSAFGGKSSFSPSVAWRTLARPGGGVLMLHQRGKVENVATSTGAYGISCGLVHATVSVIGESNAPVAGGVLGPAVLVVDFAISKNGRDIVAVAPSESRSIFTGQVLLATIGEFTAPGSCSDGGPGGVKSITPSKVTGEATAVALTNDDTVVVQTREPAQVWIGSKAIALPGASRADTGHLVFHTATNARIACASCHPEGGDDGRVWVFEKLGKRRTQSFRGGLLGTEPFHWSGDIENFEQLVKDVFMGRMCGPDLRPDQIAVLARWVDTVPLLPHGKPSDPAAVARGELLFRGNEQGCASCHSGEKLTSNATTNVGTGISLQVPSLRGVGFRAPYLHDGCAPTLFDRFGPCGGGDKHGHTSHLSDAQLQDLVAYLETL